MLLQPAQYAMLAAEVILWPNYYCDLVTSGQITMAGGTYVPPSPFTGYFNATLLGVARFFAEQGLSITDIKDAVFYTVNWIYSYALSSSDVVLASFMSSVCLPLGYNEDYWSRTTSHIQLSKTTMSSATNAIPIVATNSAGTASSSPAPATTITTSSEAAPTSTEAVQQMDET
ncbi:hypothetical protein BDP27DRAFT_1405321 [Rhodocollybia butyracea]|uniref:Uncharacterized protein n=1 Tax=Rhodocollybia butyracea TaxID=206335 RepID=A0A9P5PM30_9AGAR|nr:hypothetical protein BDP27DRAFT_1405321 [Rhodocollybia butyracea]